MLGGEERLDFDPHSDNTQGVADSGVRKAPKNMDRIQRMEEAENE